MATTAASVRGTLETDPISAQGQNSLISDSNITTVRADLRSNTSPLEVLTKAVASDANYNGSLMEMISNKRIRTASDRRFCAATRFTMSGDRDFSIADDKGRAVWQRPEAAIEFSTEVFAQSQPSLTADPHQALSKPEV